MSTISKDEKLEIIKKFGHSDKDTGRTEVQIALLSARISSLTEHFKANPKDHHSRRGLLQLVSKRKQLLKYLARKDYKSFEQTTTTLSIRRSSISQQ